MVKDNTRRTMRAVMYSRAPMAMQDAMMYSSHSVARAVMGLNTAKDPAIGSGMIAMASAHTLHIHISARDGNTYDHAAQ